MIVVDASVAAKWVIDEPYTEAAQSLLNGNDLHAPGHWIAEASNAVWTRVVRGEIEPRDASERAALLARAPVSATDLVPLLPRAFAIAVACSATVYDTLYVALAEARDAAFVTADRRLISRLAAWPDLARRAIWIGDVEVEAG